MEPSLAGIAENPHDGPRDGDHSPNSDFLESRLEQGLASTDPAVKLVEHYEDYQGHRREKENEAFEKKIKHHVLLSLRSKHIKLWQPPYYQAEKRNDEALQHLATTIAESSNDVKEVLLSLRYYQKKSVEFHCKRVTKTEEVESCSVAQKVLHKLRVHDIHLWEPPYFMDDGMRNNESLEQLASALAECPSEVDEILLALRVYQVRSLKKRYNGSTFGYCDVATD